MINLNEIIGNVVLDFPKDSLGRSLLYEVNLS